MIHFSRLRAAVPTARLDIGVCFLLVSVYFLWRAPLAMVTTGNSDHNFQISMGTAVLHGMVPGVDFFTFYGPFVALASALALPLGGYAGEMLVCGLFYAVAITLAASLLFLQGRRFAGYLCAIALSLLLARFYKWYFWLFQILPLLFLIWRLQGGGMGAVFAWGGAGGMALLFRLDLGAVSLIFGLAALLLWDPESRAPRPLVRRMMWFLIGFSLLPSAWSLMIYGKSDWRNVVDFYGAYFAGAEQMMGIRMIPPFRFDLSQPLSRQTVLALAQTAVVAIYSVGLGFGLRAAWRRSGEHRAIEFGAAALLGIGVLPQALHRADTQHLLQVIVPFVLCCFLLSGLWRWRGALLGAIALGCLLGAGLPYGGQDLGPLVSDPRQNWRDLRHFPASTPHVGPVAAGLAIRRHSTPDAAVFLAMNETLGSVFVAADRRFAGIIPTYFPGLGSDAHWERRIRDSLAADPPRFIVARRSAWFAPDGPSGIAPYYPDLLQDWRRRYGVIVHENPSFLVLAEQCPAVSCPVP